MTFWSGQLWIVEKKVINSCKNNCLPLIVEIFSGLWQTLWLGLSMRRSGRVCAQRATNLYKIRRVVFHPTTDSCYRFVGLGCLRVVVGFMWNRKSLEYAEMRQDLARSIQVLVRSCQIWRDFPQIVWRNTSSVRSGVYCARNWRI